MELTSKRLHPLLLTGAFIALAATAPPTFGENSAVVPVPKESENWLKRQREINESVSDGKADLLWIGDSIVENWIDQGKATWNKYYAGRGARNLGIGGDKTQHLLWRLDHGNLEGISPTLAIIMMGQNNGGTNTAEEIAEGVAAIVERLRTKLPDTKILLLGIFFRGEKPNDEQVKLARTNEIIARLDDGNHVFYRNINNLFLLPDASISAVLMPDFEHPSAEGHRVWAEAIESGVAMLMGDSAIIP